MKTLMTKFWQEEDGQDMVEYSLLLGFIALAAAAGMTTLNGKITAVWTAVGTSLTSAAS